VCVKYVCVFVFFAASHNYTNTVRIVISLDLRGPHVESGKEAVSIERFPDFIYSL
jgi:hypothetical protein